MIAVIGDIHGCFYTLKTLVEKIKIKYPGIRIYSVGDLIDRGNFSCEVIDYIQKENILFTPGNHDYMFYYFVNYPATDMANSWLYNGYETTMQSYKGREDKINYHLSLIEKAPLFFNLDDCFISHAGISKKYKSILSKNIFADINLLYNVLSRDITETYSIVWTRGELLNIGKLQIVGHTRRHDILINKQSNVVYIDTSIYTGNKLSAVIVNKNELIDLMYVDTFFEDLT